MHDWPAVGRSVVQDPEHSPRVAIRGLAHDLLDQTVEGLDSRGLLAASEELGAVHIESGQVRPGTTTLVFVLDAYATAALGRQGGVDAGARLDAGLLVS